MGATTVYQLPYPEAAEPADVPLDMRELADRIEAVFSSKLSDQLAYVERTTDLTVNATTSATADVIFTTGVLSYAAAPILISFYTAMARTPAGAGVQLLINLWDGASNLGYLASVLSPAAAALGVPVYASRRLTPAAGSHEYRALAWITSGAGGLILAAGAMPAYLRVTRAP